MELMKLDIVCILLCLVFSICVLVFKAMFGTQNK